MSSSRAPVKLLVCLCMRTPSALSGIASSRDSNKRSSWDSSGSVLRSGHSSSYTGSILRFMRSKDGHYMGATHAGISPPLMGDIVHRTSSREASISTPSSSQRSFSDSSVRNGSRRRLGRFWFSNPSRSNDEEGALMEGLSNAARVCLVLPGFLILWQILSLKTLGADGALSKPF